MNPDVILEHFGGSGIMAFDFLSLNKKKKVALKDYTLVCSYVESFLVRHPDYHYRGSTDLGHIEGTNNAIMREVQRMIANGWQLIILTEKEPKQ